MKMRRLSLFLFSLSIFSARAEAPEANGASAANALETYFSRAETRDKTRRHWGVGLLGVSSLASLGIAFASESPGRKMLFGSVGGVLAAGAVSQAFHLSETERLAAQYRRFQQEKVSDDFLQTWARVSLGDLRDEVRSRRRFGGAFLIAVGGAMVLSHAGSEYVRNEHGYLVYEGVILATLGTVGLFLRSEYEREIEETLEATTRAKAQSTRWQITPTPLGLAARLTF